eukprot:3021566-Rhodomonas_salina.1
MSSTSKEAKHRRSSWSTPGAHNAALSHRKLSGQTVTTSAETPVHLSDTYEGSEFRKSSTTAIDAQRTVLKDIFTPASKNAVEAAQPEGPLSHPMGPTPVDAAPIEGRAVQDAASQRKRERDASPDAALHKHLTDGYKAKKQNVEAGTAKGREVSDSASGASVEAEQVPFAPATMEAATPSQNPTAGSWQEKSSTVSQTFWEEKQREEDS